MISLKSILNTVTVRAKPFDTGWIQIPGVGTGAAYASGDSFGIPFSIRKMPKTGRIETLLFIDEDKEELAFDLALFDDDITATADNSAFDLLAADVEKQIGVIPVTAADYVTYANTSIAEVGNMGRRYSCPSGRVVAHKVTRGAPNIAAGKRMAVRLLGYSDGK